MKNNKQLRIGNVVGAGHGNPLNRYAKGLIPIAHIPTNPVRSRQARRMLRTLRRGTEELKWPVWARMSQPLYWMFHRAGLMATPESVPQMAP